MSSNSGEWTVSVSNDRTVLNELGTELDSLLSAVDAPVCARRLWLTVWVDSFVEFTPWTMWVREDGELQAVALLAERTRAGHSEIVGLGHGPSDYARLPTRSAEGAERLSEALADALQARRRPWRLRVDGLPAEDPVATALTQRLRQACVVRSEAAPRLFLRPDRSIESVMNAKDRRSLRETPTSHRARRGIYGAHGARTRGMHGSGRRRACSPVARPRGSPDERH